MRYGDHQKQIYNCPNCAAPIGYSPVCEYCGTRLVWFPAVASVETVFVNVKPVRASVTASKDLRRFPKEVVLSYAKDSLKQKFADFVEKVWDLDERPDPIKPGATRYTATIYLGMDKNVSVKETE